MSELRTVAVLYTDPRGVYHSMPGVDAWDEARDARLYDGPHPVVAHPPCGPWANLRHLSNGAGADCGPRAFEQVRAFGGVLEQPAGSKLFAECAAPMPFCNEDRFGGFTLQVEQVSWGHVARKKTWLYVLGVSRSWAAACIRTGGEPTHWVSGGRNQMRKNGKQGGGVVPPGIKVCSAQQRRRTPPAFAEFLVSLARSVQLPSSTGDGR